MDSAKKESFYSILNIDTFFRVNKTNKRPAILESTYAEESRTSFLNLVSFVLKLLLRFILFFSAFWFN